jgi:hypothetical protein
VDQVAIVNMALASFGERERVSSINPSDGSNAADNASLIYTTRTQSLMRSAHWDCLKKQALLTVVKAAPGTPENPDGTITPTPPLPWLYSYAYPSDCLKARYILPFTPMNATASTVPLTTAISAMPMPISVGESVAFSIGYDSDALGNPGRVILTNMPQATLVYTANVSDPNFWDPNLIEAQTAYLAVWLCNAMTRSSPLLHDMIALSQNQISNARAMNGNEGTQIQDHVPDWIRIRGGGSLAYSGTYSLGWDSIAFPGGIANF